MEIFKKFSFEAAHRLPNAPPGHKCRRLHGHSFRVGVHVAGRTEPVAGWVIDFADINRAMQPLLDVLDHNYLNDVRGLENPTSEAIARWVWERLHPVIPQLTKVVIHETCSAGCMYTGSDG